MVPDRHNHVLLTTKLMIPPSYARFVVPRARLYRRLEDVLEYPLTLITAPAGFGKTSLISEWLGQGGRGEGRDALAAWVSLEKSDNTLTRFWSYILTALDKLYVSRDEQAPVLHSLLSMDVEHMLSSLINILAEFPHDILLALDNYQSISSPSIQNSVEFFLEHMPLRAHLIIIARVDPPLPLARLRVRGQLLELNANDLRFTLEEATEFLNQRMKLELNAEQIASLWQYTEGWIVGLHLIALSLQNRRSPALANSSLKRLDAAHRSLSNYLMEEVLNPLPEAIQTFLLMTAVLERMTASLCDAVTGHQDGETMLAWLDQSQLFVTALDDQGKWYHYHQCFANALQQRLRQQNPDLALELHVRASCWYEQQGMMTEAVEHAVTARSFERAADLMERCALSLILHGEVTTVLSWLKVLQGKIVFSARPVLLQMYTFILLVTGRQEEFARSLLSLEQTWREQENKDMLAGVFHLRSFEAYLRGDGMQAVTYSHQALMLTHESTPASVMCLVHLAAGYLWRGDLTRAHSALLQGQQMNQPKLWVLATASIALHLGDCYRFQGHLYEAAAMYQQALQEGGARLFWYRIIAFTRLGNIYREWNKYEEAEAYLSQAQAIVKQNLPECLLPECDQLAAQLAWIRGEYDQAMQWVDRAEDSAQRLGEPQIMLARVAALRIVFLLTHGEVEAAVRWGEEKIPPRDDALLFEQEALVRARARLLIAQKKSGNAVEMLEEALRAAGQQGRRDSEIALRIIFAVAHYTNGQMWRAKQVLEQALIQGEAGGYCRVFLDEGDAVAVILTELYALHRKRTADEERIHLLEYMRSLLKAFKRQVDPDVEDPLPPAEPVPPESLSEREREVLRLLAAGYSSRQIARALIIAESTVKTHLKSIYAKLHVRSRLQAMKKASGLGLLPGSEKE